MIPFKDKLLDQSWIYSLFQLPFAKAKMAPFIAAEIFSPGQSVLELGCGPGTNFRFLPRAKYLGVDLNDHYIQSAKRAYGSHFKVGDVRELAEISGSRFNIVLANSLFHHIDDIGTKKTFAQVVDLLDVEGRFCIIDLIQAPPRTVASLLVRLDRGSHARTVEQWRELIGSCFSISDEVFYAIGARSIPLWNLGMWVCSLRS